jgi:protein phosphatase
MSLFRRRKESKASSKKGSMPDNAPVVGSHVIETHDTPADIKNPVNYLVYNVQGCGKRSGQEDAFAFVNALDAQAMESEGLLAVVADGMGGLCGGNTASEIVTRSLKHGFTEINRNGDIAIQLRNDIMRASDNVYDELKGDGGSTAIACMLYEKNLYFASIGDSGIYIFRNNRLCQLNRPHNMLHTRYAETIRSGETNPMDARADQERKAVTQFAGMKELTDVDYLHRPLPLHNGDVILICSDGISGVLSEETISECLKMKDPYDMGTELEKEIELADEKFQDNYTALIIQCTYDE